MECVQPRRNASAQRIPRVIRQTHKAPFSQLPPLMLAAVSAWRSKNPEWRHCYYDDVAMRADVASRGRLVPGFLLAFGNATSGAMRTDLWRTMLIKYVRRSCRSLPQLCRTVRDTRTGLLTVRTPEAQRTRAGITTGGARSSLGPRAASTPTWTHCRAPLCAVSSGPMTTPSQAPQYV